MATAGVLAQLLSHLSIGRVLGSIALFVVTSFVVDIFQLPRYPKTLPRVGHGAGTIATVRNWLGYVFHFPEWVTSGYEKYSKNGRAFVVPSAASRPQELVIPPSQASWMLELPDHVLSSNEAQNEVMYGEYQFLGREYSSDPFHVRIIHRNLARNLNELIPNIQDEVHAAVDEAFGLDTDNWKSLSLWEAWLTIVPRVTNLVLVGPEVCRNETFLKGMVHFADDVVVNSFILNMFPKTLHPIVARLITITNWWHWRKSHAVIAPVIAERLDRMARKEAGDPALRDWEPPEDFITWGIRMARAEGKTAELNPVSLSKRLVPVEFAAIHTTVITGHFLVLDLLCSDPALGYIESIREEADRVFRECDGRWTNHDLWRLYRADSAIRESQRVSNFATSLTKRKVVAPEGITHPTEGWHVPRGGWLMLPLDPVHHDADLHEDPEKYDPFRYSRLREEFDARRPQDKDADEGLQLKKLGMVTTSEKHMAFGHGRHACPGRFFVAHEMKMILAYLLRNYELKPLKEREKPTWVGQTIIPPVGAKIEVRRRKGTV